MTEGLYQIIHQIRGYIEFFYFQSHSFKIMTCGNRWHENMSEFYNFFFNMAAVTNDADGLPQDRHGNNLPLENYDEDDSDTKSVDLVSGTRVTPEKEKVGPRSNNYKHPLYRKKRDLLPSLPAKPAKVMKVKKMEDPKPTIYFPTELDRLENKKRCGDCHHSTCHDLMYGDFCGLQATEGAKKYKDDDRTDDLFLSLFTNNYTSSLKFHRYLTTGVIDTVVQYSLPACMVRSSFRNFFAVYKIDVERSKMRKVVRSGIFYEVRTEPYEFKDDNENEKQAD